METKELVMRWIDLVLDIVRLAGYTDIADKIAKALSL